MTPHGAASLSNVSVTKVEEVTASTLDVEFQLNALASDPLQLTTYAAGKEGVDDSEAADYSAVKYRYYGYDANGVLKPSTLATGSAPTRTYQLQMTGYLANGTTALTNEQIDALKSKQFNFSVNRGVSETSSRIKAWASTTTIVVGSAYVADSESVNATLPATINSAAITNVNAFVAIYVDGSDSGSAENVASLTNLKLSVTIADPAN